MLDTDTVLAVWGFMHGHPRVTMYDPFAGVGKGVDYFNDRGWDAWGTELEPEWAKQSVNVTCADSLAYMKLPGLWLGGIYAPFPVDCVFTSPTYANRMADHHNAADRCKACIGRTMYEGCDPCRKCDGTGLSKRNTYRHKLGRPLSEGSSAGMQWGDEYRTFHTQAWAGVYGVLKPGGYFLLNVKDHIRKGDRCGVALWHHEMCLALGFKSVSSVPVPVRGNGFGQNGQTRVDHEWLFLYRKL